MSATAKRTTPSAAPKICYSAPMTMLEKFVEFAQTLSADRMESLETTLAQIMDSWSGKYDFTPGQLAELDRRMAEEHPEYSREAVIVKIFGKPFSA